MAISQSIRERKLIDSPFQWQQTSFKYLDVQFPRKSNEIVRANLNPLIMELTNDLNRWQAFPLSLWGKVNTIRMNILPRLLSILSTLPVSVPSLLLFLKFNMFQVLGDQERNKTKQKVIKEIQEPYTTQYYVALYACCLGGRWLDC